jgi:hypothetical protein
MYGANNSQRINADQVEPSGKVVVIPYDFNSPVILLEDIYTLRSSMPYSVPQPISLADAQNGEL